MQQADEEHVIIIYNTVYKIKEQVMRVENLLCSASITGPLNYKPDISSALGINVGGDTEAPWKTPDPKSMVPETHLAVVSATKQKTETPTTSTKAPVDENIPGKTTTSLKAHPFLAGFGGDTEAPRKTPVS